MDITDIMRIIPHRPPMLLLDRIVEIVPGERIVAIKNVSMNEPFFVGHYPDMPVMPGVLIVEALAQAGACAVLSLEAFLGKTPLFAGIEKCKFRRKVTPGDTLRLEVQLVKLRNRSGIGIAKAFVEGVLACEAELTFIIID